MTLEIVVDNFAGGGGASTGIEAALGVHVTAAINHNPEALALHRANHPSTQHYVQSIINVDPRDVAQGRPVGLAWFSPDCRHFSKAKGAAPRSKSVRDLAWVVVHWAELVRPRVIILENVEEFTTWGPLLPDGQPCPGSRGLEFRRWVRELRRRGYRVEWRELRACDYGAPTWRKRLFLVARCDGESIVWPEPTHGPGRIPYRTAADCIDWSVPCPSIFGRTRPLAQATLRRIARGVIRYVLNTTRPFLVPLTHTKDLNRRPLSCDEPMPVVTTARGGEFALCSALLAEHGSNRRFPLDRREAVHAFLIAYYNTGTGQALDEPLRTGTTHDRFGLVTVEGRDYCIADIGMRMLTPRELFRAQGFPDDYRLDVVGQDGRPLPKTALIRACGNSVCPPVAEAVVRANVRLRSVEPASLEPVAGGLFA